jgi:hypothetical protein
MLAHSPRFLVDPDLKAQTEALLARISGEERAALTR